jgi:hypothetical protein
VTVPPHSPDRDTSVSTILYVGGTARQITPDLTIHGLGGALAEVRLTSVADRHDLKVWRAADVPGDGHVTDVPTILDSAVRLTISTPAGVPWPNVVVNAITVQDAPTGPEEGALVVSPRDTIDTVFDDPARALFVKIPAGQTAIDLVAFGAGDVLVADPTTSNDFVLDASIAWGDLSPERSGPPAAMLQVSAPLVSASHGLRLTWVAPDAAAIASGPFPGHARLVIRSVDDLKLAFPARDRNAFYGHFIGVDHDGSKMAKRNCATLNVACKTNALLDKLACTDWNQRNGLVTESGIRAPSPGPLVCYDGHPGSDFILKQGVIGQAGGVDVTAARAGIVVFAEDGHRDDCFLNPFGGDIQCADVEFKRPFWEELRPRPQTLPNLVGIVQDDGLVAWYFHLRQGSVSVVQGQTVACGQKIGQVGSSGNSALPHLHYELRALRQRHPMLDQLTYDAVFDETDTIDPFPNMWASWSDGSVADNACPNP